ncbi:MAG: endonuclease/exonuclease/phosphatase family protein [Prevotella sp.]|nr:endonuclease/exonuclease/phosphatase family protein [Prevotella sp.]
MKKRIAMGFALLFVFLLTASAQQMLVGSYNIRYKNADDSLRGDYWPKRCQVICDQVNFMSPDIFGAQEVLHPQLLDLMQRLDNYSYIGVGRDDGKEAGEYAAIFYKKDRVKLLDEGHFWLSENPEKPGLGWDAACIRICTWGKFKNLKTKKKFFYFNLHMDHVGTTARREAAKLVVQRIKEIAKGGQVILTGDFNVDQDNEIYRIFTESGVLKDSYTAARIRFAENGTFNSFQSNLFTKSRIDHVFVSPSTQVEAYGVLTNSYWSPNMTAEERKASDAPQEISFRSFHRRLPSDHYPVFVKLK